MSFIDIMLKNPESLRAIQYQKDNDIPPENPDKPLVKVLSLDAGGNRVIYMIRFLQLLEEQLGQSIFDTFDVISGCSAGGVMTLLTTHPNLKFTKPYKIGQIPPVFLGMSNVSYGKESGDEDAAKYDDQNIEKYWKSIFGRNNFGLNTFGKDVMIVAFEPIAGKIKAFKSWDVNSRKYPIHTVIRATGMLPAEFNAVKFENEFFYDGGITAQDTSALIKREIKNRYKNSNILIFSVGNRNTGEEGDPNNFHEYYDKNNEEWNKTKEESGSSQLTDLFFATQLYASNYINGFYDPQSENAKSEVFESSAIINSSIEPSIPIPYLTINVKGHSKYKKDDNVEHYKFFPNLYVHGIDLNHAINMITIPKMFFKKSEILKEAIEKLKS